MGLAYAALATNAGACAPGEVRRLPELTSASLSASSRARFGGPANWNMVAVIGLQAHAAMLSSLLGAGNDYLPWFRRPHLRGSMSRDPKRTSARTASIALSTYVLASMRCISLARSVDVRAASRSCRARLAKYAKSKLSVIGSASSTHDLSTLRDIIWVRGKHHLTPILFRSPFQLIRPDVILHRQREQRLHQIGLSFQLS